MSKKAGRPAFEPTPKDRAQVEALASVGIDHLEICRLIINPKSGKPIAPKTLRKVFRTELDVGMTKANARVAESLFMQAVGTPAKYDAEGHKLSGAIAPNVAAAIYWTKARMGWKETHTVEMSGKNGGAIPIVITKNQSEY